MRNICNDSALMPILSIAKKIMTLIQIVIPIILIVGGTISFIKLLKNPNEKNGNKKIINQFIAAAIVFFLPVIVNAVMLIIGNNTNLSKCWNNAEDNIFSTKYFEIYKERKKIINNQDSYEKSSGELSNTGLGTAQLAIRVVPTATPQPSLHTPKSNADAGAWCKTKDERLYDYFKIMDETIGKYPNHDDNNPGRKQGINNNNAYASCAQAVAGIIRATVDPDFETGSPDLELDYLAQNEEKWTLVSRLKAGTRYDSICEPGDIIFLEKFSNHVMIYVGNELVKEKFPNSNGDMYEASYSENRYPTITHHEIVYGSYARVYRNTGKGNHYYPFIDIEKVLNNQVDLNKQMC